MIIDEEVEPLPLPARSPNVNTIAQLPTSSSVETPSNLEEAIDAILKETASIPAPAYEPSDVSFTAQENIISAILEATQSLPRPISPIAFVFEIESEDEFEFVEPEVDSSDEEYMTF